MLGDVRGDRLVDAELLEPVQRAAGRRLVEQLGTTDAEPADQAFPQGPGAPDGDVAGAALDGDPVARTHPDEVGDGRVSDRALQLQDRLRR